MAFNPKDPFLRAGEPLYVESLNSGLVSSTVWEAIGQVNFPGDSQDSNFPTGLGSERRGRFCNIKLEYFSSNVTVNSKNILINNGGQVRFFVHNYLSLYKSLQRIVIASNNNNALKVTVTPENTTTPTDLPFNTDLADTRWTNRRYKIIISSTADNVSLTTLGFHITVDKTDTDSKLRIPASQIIGLPTPQPPEITKHEMTVTLSAMGHTPTHYAINGSTTKAKDYRWCAYFHCGYYDTRDFNSGDAKFPSPSGSNESIESRYVAPGNKHPISLYKFEPKITDSKGTELTTWTRFLSTGVGRHYGGVLYSIRVRGKGEGTLTNSRVTCTIGCHVIDY
jgi:hypothetical protein